MALIDKPLTNLQLELLKLYSHNLSDKELLDIQRLLAQYFADKASDEMDRLRDENSWNNNTMDEWLEENDKGDA